MSVKQAMIDYTQHAKHDMFRTPDYAIAPLLPYLPKDKVIWEPTSIDGKSGIYDYLISQGYAVEMSDFDFLLNDCNDGWDIIVTNPPFSLKNKFIEKCMSYGKPWAMLLPITALEGVERRKMFNEMGKDFGLIVLDRRVEFMESGVWFNTSWFTYKLDLPSQILFKEIDK